MIQHGSGRDDGRLAHGIHHHHQPHHYVQHIHHRRPQQPQLDIQSALNSYHYPAPQPVHYTYQPPPQSPPSPPVEELNKPSLPSISSLLGIADSDPKQEAGQQQQAAQQLQKEQVQHIEQQQRMQQAQQQAQQHQQAVQASQGQDIRPHYTQGVVVNQQKMTLPPTPPLQPDSAVDGNHSPSTISSHSSLSAPPYYLGQSLNNVEPHQQRQPLPGQGLVKRHSMPLQTSGSPYTTSPYASSPYATSPGAASTPGYYSPESQVYTNAGLYHQRPLPSNFPPPVAVNMPPNPSAANPWQHHHYISASSQAAFPQSQDRYICQTCNKAFSRPSSLRIHSHSHTGEKPFKCPHAGCGKAFSVRSNMKRHERGCHANPGAALSAS